VSAYNIFAVFVTHFLSSIAHAILDGFRPVTVWGTDLAIYYLITHGQYGEAWTRFSWLQFGGMCLLFFGTAVYNGSISWFVTEVRRHALWHPSFLDCVSPRVCVCPRVRRSTPRWKRRRSG
jgi:hypothetical protein